MNFNEINEGISRKNMPQIKSDDLSKLIAYLNENGHPTEFKMASPWSLTPLQTMEKNNKTVNKIKKAVNKGGTNEGIDKPVIVSTDGLIIDGHHRRMAAMYLDVEIPTLVVEGYVVDILTLLKEFSTNQESQINEDDGWELSQNEEAFISNYVMNLLGVVATAIKKRNDQNYDVTGRDVSGEDKHVKIEIKWKEI
jgi:hypothetical protein